MALLKFAPVESRFCSCQRRGKATFETPINPCARSACSRSVAVGLKRLSKTLEERKRGRGLWRHRRRVAAEHIAELAVMLIIIYPILMDFSLKMLQCIRQNARRKWDKDCPNIHNDRGTGRWI